MATFYKGITRAASAVSLTAALALGAASSAQAQNSMYTPPIWLGIDASINPTERGFQAGGGGTLLFDSDDSDDIVTSLGASIEADLTAFGHAPFFIHGGTPILGAAGRVFLNEQSVALNTDNGTAGDESLFEFQRLYYLWLFTGLRFDHIFEWYDPDHTRVSATIKLGPRVERSRFSARTEQGGNIYTSEETDTYVAFTGGIEFAAPLNELFAGGANGGLGPSNPGPELTLGVFAHQVPGQSQVTPGLVNMDSSVDDTIDVRFSLGVKIPLSF